MKFLVDAQLPKILAEWLCFKGYDAIHTLELPFRNATDDLEIRKIARQEGRIVISKDRDFFDSHLLHRNPEKLILIRTGNTPNPILMELIKENLPTIISFISDNFLVEIGPKEIVCHK